MTVVGYCVRCAPAIPGGFMHEIDPDYKPSHCYGGGDEPGTRGLIGSGFHCDCECRRWPHSPQDLYNLAASEHPGDLPAIRDRYRVLMVEHGHLIPGKPKPLPCGWPKS